MRRAKVLTVLNFFSCTGLTYNQINNNLTSQAATMVTNGLPNDVLSNLDPLALIIFIPICDRLVYPALARAGIRFTPIKRITAGFFAGAAAMAWAAVVQHYIYQVLSTSPVLLHSQALRLTTTNPSHLTAQPLRQPRRDLH
jgi:POT family proton-dependent oligopeptide transporter